MATAAINSLFGAHTTGTSWTPASLPTLTAWWDASNAGSITSSGGLVSAWADLSANGYTLAQSTGGAKPQTGVDTINSKNVFKMDGARYMTNAALTCAPTNRTLLAVVIATTNTKGNIVGPTSSGGVNMWSQGSGGNQTLGMDRSFVTGLGSSSSTYANSTAHVIEYEIQASSQAWWIDGAAAGTNSSSSSLTGGGDFQMGANEGGEMWVGDIAEIIISDAVLSTGDRQSAEAYLKAKWGTP